MFFLEQNRTMYLWASVVWPLPSIKVTIFISMILHTIKTLIYYLKLNFLIKSKNMTPDYLQLKKCRMICLAKGLVPDVQTFKSLWIRLCLKTLRLTKNIQETDNILVPNPRFIVINSNMPNWANFKKFTLINTL